MVAACTVDGIASGHSIPGGVSRALTAALHCVGAAAREAPLKGEAKIFIVELTAR